MYVHTSFRGAKTCKIAKKGVFLVILTNFGKDMMEKIRKTHAENTYLGSSFIPEKYVFRVCFESPFMRMISNLKYKAPQTICAEFQMCFQLGSKPWSWNREKKMRFFVLLIFDGVIIDGQPIFWVVDVSIAGIHQDWNIGCPSIITPSKMGKTKKSHFLFSFVGNEMGFLMRYVDNYCKADGCKSWKVIC